jgi:glutathione S-transferase
MKLYDSKVSPNSRRVRMFLAEKGITIEKEECWADGKSCLREDFLARYPFRLIPMLELDDGRQIGESTAICRYFEELYPEPSLFGRDALEKALVEMWHQRVHTDGEIAAEEVVRNSFPPMAQRGLAGAAELVAQIPALVKRGKRRLLRCFHVLNTQLTTQQFVAGARFSMADITTLCAVDFAKFAAIEMPLELHHLARWYGEISTRASASA